MGSMKVSAGAQYGRWTALEHVQVNGKWLWRCSCSCGNESYVRANKLLTGQSKSCGCRERSYTDYAGKRFGRWTAIKRVRVNGQPEWLCKCDCGQQGTVRLARLKGGQSQSCGCQRRSQIDLTGKAFGRLTVIRKATDTGVTRWLCRCECGSERVVPGSALKAGHVRSCGNRRAHSKSHDQTYAIWNAMIQRCHNPKHASYDRYGGRGIIVCDRWRQSYDAFLDDVGERPSTLHSIDRIDNAGNYEPGNVRWATSLQQSRNTRRSIVVFYQGQRMSLREAYDMANSPVAYGTVWLRLKNGMSVEDAIHTPRLR